MPNAKPRGGLVVESHCCDTNPETPGVIRNGSKTVPQNDDGRLRLRCGEEPPSVPWRFASVLHFAPCSDGFNVLKAKG
jgi:hypothetical protein